MLAEDLSPNPEHLEGIIATKRARLEVREKQQTYYGIGCAPEIVIEIDELRRDIAEITARIEKLRQPAPPAWPRRTPAIMLLEDDPMLIVALHAVIADLNMNYDIVMAGNYGQIHAQFSLRTIPLVITELLIDDRGNGLHFARLVKKISPTTQVVMMTSLFSVTRELRAETSIDHVLCKPFSLDDFKAIAIAMLIRSEGPQDS